MKKSSCFIVLSFLLLVLVVRAEGQFQDEAPPPETTYHFKNCNIRTWSSPNGTQRVKAKLVRVDIRKPTAWVVLDKGGFATSEGWINYLSEKDQKYVLKMLEQDYGKELAESVTASSEATTQANRRIVQQIDREIDRFLDGTDSRMPRNSYRNSLTKRNSDPQSNHISTKAQSSNRQNQKCHSCNGTGTKTERCPSCHPSMRNNCTSCQGSGKRQTGLSHTRSGSSTPSYSPCNICGGTGLKPCQRCQDTKTVSSRCNSCSGRGYK